MREQLAFGLVLAGVAVGFVLLLALSQNWRVGAGVIGAVIVVAGVLRLFLPTVRAGHLAARSRGVDTVLYLVLGGLILAVDIRLRT